MGHGVSSGLQCWPLLQRGHRLPSAPPDLGGSNVTTLPAVLMRCDPTPTNTPPPHPTLPTHPLPTLPTHPLLPCLPSTPLPAGPVLQPVPGPMRGPGPHGTTKQRGLAGLPCPPASPARLPGCTQ